MSPPPGMASHFAKSHCTRSHGEPARPGLLAGIWSRSRQSAGFCAVSSFCGVCSGVYVGYGARRSASPWPGPAPACRPARGVGPGRRRCLPPGGRGAGHGRDRPRHGDTHCAVPAAGYTTNDGGADRRPVGNIGPAWHRHNHRRRMAATRDRRHQTGRRNGPASSVPPLLATRIGPMPRGLSSPSQSPRPGRGSRRWHTSSSRCRPR